MTDLYILSPNGKRGREVRRIDLVSHGNVYRLALVTQAGNLILKGDAQALIDLFEPIVSNAKASLGLIPPGIVRAETPDTDYTRFEFDDLLPDIDDIEEDMPVAEKLAILINRFENSPANKAAYSAGFVNDLKAIYKKEAGHDYDDRPTVPVVDVLSPSDVSQADIDLEKVEPYINQIIVNGTANRSAIARILQISNGGGNWQRLDDVAKALEARAA